MLNRSRQGGMNEILSTTMSAFQKLDRQLLIRIDGRQAAMPVLIAGAGENAARRSRIRILVRLIYGL